MAHKIYKSFALATLFVLGLVNTYPFVVAAETVDEVSEATIVSQEEVTITRWDLLAAAQRVYNEGSLTDEQFNAIFALCVERIGAKGVNKRVALGNGYYDNYVDSLNWNALLVTGGVGLGSLIGLIPGINAAWAAALVTVGGGLGGHLLNGDNGVIVRTRQVRRVDPVRGLMVYDEFVSVRDQ